MSNEFDENIPSTSSAAFLQNNDVIENNVLESDESEGSEEYLTPADASLFFIFFGDFWAILSDVEDEFS